MNEVVLVVGVIGGIQAVNIWWDNKCKMPWKCKFRWWW